MLMQQFSFAQFAQRLEAAGYTAMSPDIVLHGWLTLHDCRADARGIPALLLDGPPGTGKSFYAEILAEILDAERITFQFVPGTRREDLLYDLDLSQVILGMTGARQPESFSDLTSPGVLVRAAEMSQRSSVVLHLDELDKANEKIDAFLLEFLQSGVLHLPHVGTIRANPANLIVILTKNDQRLVTPPLLRRVRSVTIGYPALAVEMQILTRAVPSASVVHIKALITLANKLRHHRDEMLHVPSTPELMRCLRDLAAAPAQLAGHVVENTLIRHPEDRRHLKETVAELAGTFRAIPTEVA
jgi:MoxR-like ATPase